MLHLTMILPSTEPLCNFFQQNHIANNIHTVIQPPPTSEKARQLLQYPSKRTRRTFYVILYSLPSPKDLSSASSEHPCQGLSLGHLHENRVSQIWPLPVEGVVNTISKMIGRSSPVV